MSETQVQPARLFSMSDSSLVNLRPPVPVVSPLSGTHRVGPGVGLAPGGRFFVPELREQLGDPDPARR